MSSFDFKTFILKTTLWRNPMSRFIVFVCIFSTYMYYGSITILAPLYLISIFLIVKIKNQKGKVTLYENRLEVEFGKKKSCNYSDIFSVDRIPGKYQQTINIRLQNGGTIQIADPYLKEQEFEEVYLLLKQKIPVNPAPSENIRKQNLKTTLALVLSFILLIIFIALDHL